ncbi:uncharacterized protein BO97DRAFT_118998 [Aspergillus homomorphus CBS 101889]|uniref:SWIM-type domain-containing protein n=1 Tax=Aspergillus homomorphus (strain CBS 101889) TaxID=1450537 RepID=A0A395HTQ5_ASPHC|nr:hypothetical protein BO97DRAFT_118998 [Aspergillus homomorphus CBS 101889]RAL10765.1 hypothetical protein BO97DRAFT_118998 [Aspergillus homomorphus CBS 101889]
MNVSSIHLQQSEPLPPAQFVDSVVSSLSTQNSSRWGNDQQQDTAPGEGPPYGVSALPANQAASVKPLILVLHCMFPNELLLALDILDRGLVKRLLSHDNPASAGEFTSEEPEDIFLVRSASMLASQSSTRYLPSQADPGTRGYEVRLQAWGCTCPTFTLVAFRGPRVASSSMPDISFTSTADVPALQSSPGRDSAVPHSPYPFGGTLTRGSAQSSPPVCKHLLASWLAIRCPDLLGKGNERFVCVSAEELAGWCAGWGG